MAETHGGQYVKEFARQMWMQLGMRVLVLSAHHDTTGTLSLARCVGNPVYISFLIYFHFNSHDCNNELGAESMASARPGWEDSGVWDEWARYARSQMGEPLSLMFDKSYIFLRRK